MKNSIYRKLENKKVVECEKEECMAFFYDVEKRTVAKTDIEGLRVSTVFLGFDHGYAGVPLYFETMVFNGSGTAIDAEDGCEFQERYETWDEAIAGHEAACEKTRNGGIK